jgi:hypothetical protein
VSPDAIRKIQRLSSVEIIMFRTSIAAATLVLVAATPSFADGFGYDARKPYYSAPVPQYDEPDSKPAVDYSGRYGFDRAHDEHCAGPGKVVVEEDGYGKQYAPRYGNGYPRYGNGY